MFLAKAGPSHKMNWYNINGNTTVPAGVRGTDPDAMNGAAVMYDAGSAHILMVGGSPSYTVRVTVRSTVRVKVSLG